MKNRDNLSSLFGTVIAFYFSGNSTPNEREKV